jgi:hypothetical protein
VYFLERIFEADPGVCGASKGVGSAIMVENIKVWGIKSREYSKVREYSYLQRKKVRGLLLLARYSYRK